jgi:hypothetical protein
MNRKITRLAFPGKWGVLVGESGRFFEPSSAMSCPRIPERSIEEPTADRTNCLRSLGYCHNEFLCVECICINFICNDFMSGVLEVMEVFNR